MQEEKNARSTSAVQEGSTGATAERLKEATNSETLSDLRADEKLSGGDSTSRDVASTPAPDGSSTTTPGSHERADGSNTGEPM